MMAAAVSSAAATTRRPAATALPSGSAWSSPSEAAPRRASFTLGMLACPRGLDPAGTTPHVVLPQAVLTALAA
jgi:hypothetical protein